MNDKSRQPPSYGDHRAARDEAATMLLAWVGLALLIAMVVQHMLPSQIVG